MSNSEIERFDPELMRKIAHVYLPLLKSYYRAEFKGLENIPDTPFLGVGNHLGMHFIPEYYLWAGMYHSEERKVPMLTLVHHMVSHLASMLNLPMDSFGFIEATQAHAISALKKGYGLTVYPGGDRENGKPFKDRNKIDFFNHTGYVKMALKAQVPILPIVGIGGGETLFILNSGEKFAEWSGLKKYAKIHTWPVYWSFPFGWHIGHFPLFSLPLPSQVTLSVLKPYYVDQFDPEDADDPAVVQHINQEIIALMQDEMDKLAKGRIPIIGKLG
ncbi:1-acyl-sn-glycerol-3-phosphate acyltransferase [Bacteroidota bacterium]